MENLYIGVDIGGTNLRAALLTDAGTVLERRRVASAISEGREAFLARLLSCIHDLHDSARQHGAHMAGICIGVPGLIGTNGVIHSSVNMKALDGFNLKNFLEVQTGLATVCANDANLIALGEQYFGAGRGYSSCLVLTIGTGLGSGLILNGKLWSGCGGYAAEFGHLTVQPDGERCSCGKRGCLELYASAGALVRFARELLPNTGCSEIGAGLDAAKVAELARAGESAAVMAFEQLGYWLGIGLGSLMNVLNPEAIIIGGGVSASFDLLQPALLGTLQQNCFEQIYDGLVVARAELGDDAGLLGGVALLAAGG